MASSAVPANNGGHLAVGNSIGTSNVGMPTLTSGSKLDFEIGTDGATSDRLNISSLLSKTGIGSVSHDLTGEHPVDGSVNRISEGTFTLLTFGYETGFGAGDFFTRSLPDGWTSTFSLNQGGTTLGSLSVTLKNNAVTTTRAPEPGLLVLCSIVGLSTLSMHRQREKRLLGNRSMEQK